VRSTSNDTDVTNRLAQHHARLTPSLWSGGRSGPRASPKVPDATRSRKRALRPTCSPLQEKLRKVLPRLRRGSKPHQRAPSLRGRARARCERPGANRRAARSAPGRAARERDAGANASRDRRRRLGRRGSGMHEDQPRRKRAPPARPHVGRHATNGASSRSLGLRTPEKPAPPLLVHLDDEVSTRGPGAAPAPQGRATISFWRRVSS
jgi:hypothetical protein